MVVDNLLVMLQPLTFGSHIAHHRFKRIKLVGEIFNLVKFGRGELLILQQQLDDKVPAGPAAGVTSSTGG